MKTSRFIDAPLGAKVRWTAPGGSTFDGEVYSRHLGRIIAWVTEQNGAWDMIEGVVPPEDAIVEILDDTK